MCVRCNFCHDDGHIRAAEYLRATLERDLRSCEVTLLRLGWPYGCDLEGAILRPDGEVRLTFSCPAHRRWIEISDGVEESTLEPRRISTLSNSVEELRDAVFTLTHVVDEMDGEALLFPQR